MGRNIFWRKDLTAENYNVMFRHSKHQIILFLILFLLTMIIFGEEVSSAESSTTAKAVIDQENKVIDITIETQLSSNKKALPSESIRMERSIEQALSVHLTDTILYTPINSYRRGVDFIPEHPNLLTEIPRVAEKGERLFPNLGKDLKSMSITYRFNIYPDIISLFPIHSRTSKVPETLAWTPTAEFSGIVIYAADPLPVRGEEEEQLLEPCLFPKIFDEELEAALEPLMVDPEVLRQDGMVHYTQSLSSGDWTDRVGFTPLRLIAKEIFGKNYTDIIISKKDMNKILSRSSNRRLIEEGKIVIILNPEKTVQQISN